MLNRPIATIIISLAILLLGYLSLSRLSVSLYPEIASPTLLVRTNYTGASPSEVERLINTPLEGSLSGLNGVLSVKSIARQGQSLVFVRFKWGHNMDLAFLAIREKLDELRFILPEQADRSQIINTTDSNQRIATLAIQSTQQNYAAEANFKEALALKEWSLNVLSRRLEQLEGVAQAILVGAPQVRVNLQYQTDALQRYELSLTEISRAVQNANLFSASGQLQDGWYQYAIKIESRLSNLEDLANTPIKTLANGRVLLLKEVASVSLAPEDPTSFALYNGADVFSILVKKTHNANTVAVFEQVQQQLEELRADYPDFSVSVVDEGATTITQSIDNLLQSLYIGGLLALLILVLFLNSSRAPFTIGISIPLSLFFTFALMFLLDIQLNIISLSGLTLGIGLLLDNSIVVLENINRYRKAGLPLKEAAAKGSQEIAFAISASTFTTVSVFLPLLFLGGFEGAFFRDLSATLSISLLASLLVALFILPVLVVFVKDRVHSSVFFVQLTIAFDKLIDSYSASVERSYPHKKKIVLLTLGILGIAVAAFLAIPKQSLPNSTPNQFRFTVQLEGNQSLAGSKLAAQQIYSYLSRRFPEQNTLFLGGYTDVSDASALLNEGLNQFSVRIATPTPKAYQDAENAYFALQQSYANWQFSPLSSSQTAVGLPTDNAAMVEIEFVGLNREKAAQEAQVLKEVLQLKFDEFSLTEIYPQKVRTFAIRFNAEQLNLFELNETQIIAVLESLGNGRWVSEWNRQDEQWTIRLSAPPVDFSDPSTIVIPVGTRFIPLTQVATWTEIEEAMQLERNQQSPVLAFATNWNYTDWFWHKNELLQTVKDFETATSSEIRLRGNALQLDKLLADMGQLLLLSVFLIYLILSIQYEDLIYPLLIVMAIPFAWIGSFFVLYLFGLSLNALSFMGMLILTGIAVNDAILKVDFMRRYYHEEGSTLKEAVYQAGKNRFKPVVMTTLTTVFGLIPMLLPFGEGYEFRQALAASLCGGMISSTLLTLYLIPLLFETIEGLRSKRKQKKTSITV